MSNAAGDPLKAEFDYLRCLAIEARATAGNLQAATRRLLQVAARTMGKEADAKEVTARLIHVLDLVKASSVALEMCLSRIEDGGSNDEDHHTERH